jgi:dTDP-4-dehydrorhamnose 3,5-epimerase-like enzyme
VNVPYNPEAEKAIFFADPTLNITWPTEYPIISKRDSCAMSFFDYINKSRM